jgi:hypothetical protein
MKPTTVATTYDWAIEYLTYLIKEGFMDETDIKGMTKRQIIKLANECETAAQARADQAKEEIL